MRVDQDVINGHQLALGDALRGDVFDEWYMARDVTRGFAATVGRSVNSVSDLGQTDVLGGLYHWAEARDDEGLACARLMEYVIGNYALNDCDSAAIVRSLMVDYALRPQPTSAIEGAFKPREAHGAGFSLGGEWRAEQLQRDPLNRAAELSLIASGIWGVLVSEPHAPVLYGEKPPHLGWQIMRSRLSGEPGAHFAIRRPFLSGADKKIDYSFPAALRNVHIPPYSGTELAIPAIGRLIYDNILGVPLEAQLKRLYVGEEAVTEGERTLLKKPGTKSQYYWADRYDY